MCGEQVLASDHKNEVGGSSPRVRGTGSEIRLGQSSLRFIPACAGNRALPRPPTGQRTVHPRVCGEQGHVNETPLVVAGSSPRVRGTALKAGKAAAINRFIPACAGNSLPCM